MKWFSHRKGLKEVRTEVQIGSIDEALRNRLWNLFYQGYIEPMGVPFRLEQMQTVMKRFWDSYLKLPINSAPYSFGDIWKETNEYFKREWYELFDFLEFIVAFHPDEKLNESFVKACNYVLEKELSAYRFVGNQIVQITSKEEISEIEEALETPFRTVNTHIEKALKLMSDRKSPDYRNSIKESISAVEAICRLITKDKKATLGQALKEVETKVALHGALKKGFSSLYGYTSSADGIRHALLEEAKLSFEDAKFMLVSCSAFVNYLIAKTSRAVMKV